ncbi:hypothetical protein CHARACLAT_026201 [Characodon lateralis]|uniref:Uncharacterized protein n=1 Tax=Characodon lateralis TaxID=208331 RepID=A0ABU7EMF0_9TELE|nr:hypothetical protein [Characodon lateralis]
MEVASPRAPPESGEEVEAAHPWAPPESGEEVEAARLRAPPEYGVVTRRWHCRPSGSRSLEKGSEGTSSREWCWSIEPPLLEKLRLQYGVHMKQVLRVSHQMGNTLHTMFTHALPVNELQSGKDPRRGWRSHRGQVTSRGRWASSPQLRGRQPRGSHGGWTPVEK